MGANSQQFAEEFLELKWISYALAELEREGKPLDADAGTIARLDRITRVLYSGIVQETTSP